jgi:hypothetical protein
MNIRRITFALSGAAGGLLAAALLPTAVAAADEYLYEPDGSSFVAEPPLLTGYAPLSLPPLFESTTGDEDFTVFDVTSSSTAMDALVGPVLETQFLGGADEWNFTVSGWDSAVPGALDPGSHVSLTLLPGGFGSELVTSDLVPLGLQETIFTPFGDLVF